MDSIKDFLDTPPTDTEKADATRSKPSVNEYLGNPIFYENRQFEGEQWDSHFSTEAPSHILNAFGEGFKQAWGQEPLGIDRRIKTEIQKNGTKDDKTYSDLINEYSTIPVVRYFNQGVIRPLAALADGAMRTLYGTARGLAATADVPPESQPLAGLTAPIGAAASAMLEGEVVLHVPSHLTTLEAYRDVTRADRARKAAMPEEYGPPAPPPTEILPERPEGPAIQYNVPEDVHAAARNTNPALFERLDQLRGQRDMIAQQIEQLGGPFAELGPNGEPVPLRTPLHEIPEVIARDAIPPEALEVDRELRRQQAEVERELLEEVAPQVREAYSSVSAPIKEEAPPLEAGAQAAPPDTTPREVANLAQRRQSIATEVAQQAVAAGHPVDVSRGIGAIWQSYFESKAARFEGALGSARDIYDLEAPSIEAGPGKGRGAYNLAENTIRLMQTADASTLIHETGHFFLEQLMRDAQRAEAPDGLKADMQAVGAWLQMEGERPTRAQHERFARGFERYVMEGTAPSSRLAKVFAQFRDWLLRIYNSVARLNAPINDTIRGVFDRLLESRSNDFVEAPERQIGENFADVHEREAAEMAPQHPSLPDEVPAKRELQVKPEEAIAKAEQIRAERDAAAKLDNRLSPDINDERDFARSSPRSIAGEPAEAGRGTEGAAVDTGQAAGEGTAAGREAGPQEPGAQRGGGTNAPANPREPLTGGTTWVGADGHFNLERINSPDDVAAAIQDGSRLNKQGPRGAATDGDLLDLSDALGTNPNQIDAKSLRLLYGAGEIDAAIKMARDNEVMLRDIAQRAADGAEEDMMEFAKATMRAQMIQNVIMAQREAWGRAGQALQNLYTPASADIMRFLKENTGRSYGVLKQMAQAIKDMPDQGTVNKLVRDTQYGRFWAPVLAYRANALLSGLYTHAVYTGGNFLRWSTDPVVSTAAASAQRAFEAFGREIPEGQRVYYTEALASMYSFTDGVREGWRAAAQAFYTGQQRQLPGSRGFTSPFATHGVDVLNLPPHYGLPYRMVAGIHSFGETMRYEQAKARLAVRQALNEGLDANGWNPAALLGSDDATDAFSKRVYDLRTDPPGEMMSLAYGRGGRIAPDVPREVQDWARIAAQSTQVANREMYIQPPDYQSAQANVIRFFHAHPAGELLFPFISIHMQILKEDYGVYLPGGFLMKDVRNQLFGREGAAKQSEAVARQIVGMGLFGLGVSLAGGDKLHGGGPVDQAEQNVWRLQHMPYSLEVGGVQIPLKGLPVIGDILTMGADLYETMHYADGNHLAAFAKGFFRTFAHPALDEGLLRDTEELTNAINEPDRYGYRYLMNYGTSFVPFSSFSRQLNNFLYSPWAKDLHPPADIASTPQAMLDNLRAVVPFADRGVANQVDVFGRPIYARGSYGHGLTGLVGAMFDQHIDSWNNDPAAQFLVNNNLGIGKPERKIDNVSLTPEQYERFSMIRGQHIYEQLTRSLPYLEKATDGMKKVRLHAMIELATKQASAAIRAQSMGTDNDIHLKAIQKKRELFQ